MNWSVPVAFVNVAITCQLRKSVELQIRNWLPTTPDAVNWNFPEDATDADVMDGIVALRHLPPPAAM